MKKKSAIGLLAVALLVIVPILTACNVTTEMGDGTWETPHIVTGGFASCFVCHTGGLSAIPVSTHIAFTDAQWELLFSQCHPLTDEVAASLVALESTD